MRHTLAVLLLVTSGPVAQGHVTIPSGFLSAEAYDRGLQFGAYPSFRCQIFSEDHLNQSMVVKELACRRNGGEPPQPGYWIGRTWSNVRIVMAETGFSQVTPAFDSNLKLNARGVFSASVSWPSHSTGPTTSIPHTWATDVRFPLTTPWAYSGKNALVLDVAFSGGVLAGGRKWSGFVGYLLDGVYSTVVANSGVAMSVGNLGTCVAPGMGWSPFCWPLVSTYAFDTGSSRTSNKFYLTATMDYYWPDVPIIYGITVQGSRQGVPIGNSCQNYHLGPNVPYIIGGRTPRHQLPYFFAGNYATYHASAVGLEVWTQAGYQHPWSGFQLTRAGYTEIKPQPKIIKATKWTWAPSSASSAGLQVEVNYLPVVRVTY